MITLTAVEELRAQTTVWRQAGMRIGLVPTMGNIHAGHIALVKAAQQHADKVVVSIFVNPTQFGPNEDYDGYPRTIESDSEQLEACQADVLFMPSVETMYGKNIEQTTKVSVPGLSDILCGASRPGHFDGVTTIVSKLFNLVRPDIAVFGEKDFQQLVILKRMNEDLAFPIEIIGVPTWREEDGLAMSSRNQYLTEKERQSAPVLYKTLLGVARQLEAGRVGYGLLSHDASQDLEKSGFLPEYVEIRREIDLKPPEPGDKAIVILAAARLGKARLIDNVRIELE